MKSLNICKYSNFSWWIYHYSKEALKALSYEYESKNLTNSKVKLILKISAQNQVRVFWRNLMFWFENFYQVHLETFLKTQRKFSKYLGGLINLDICASKKIMTARHINRIIIIICQEKRKSWDFEKWSSKSSLNILTKPHRFWAASKIFLWVLRTRSRYLGGPFILALCVGKKSLS